MVIIFNNYLPPVYQKVEKLFLIKPSDNISISKLTLILIIIVQCDVNHIMPVSI